MKKIFFIFLLLTSFIHSKAQDIFKGTWYNDEKTGKIQFYKQGDKVYGKIVWLKDPTDKNGKPLTDINNPDSKKKSTPLMGLVFLKEFVAKDAKTWEDGTIYDPNNGKTYSCNMKLESPKVLNVRGYIGISLIGRTSKFTKAD
jgi:uncharacterized protein (DUF2147 family)